MQTEITSQEVQENKEFLTQLLDEWLTLMDPKDLDEIHARKAELGEFLATRFRENPERLEVAARVHEVLK